MAKPIVNKITAFDATDAHTVSLTWAGHYTTNTIHIYNAITGAEVFTNTAVGLTNIIPADTLSNGYQYYIGATVTYETTVSELSNYIFFNCYSDPIFQFDQGTYTSEHSTVVTNLIYQQNESRPLQSYVFQLYDVNQNLVSESAPFYNNTLQYTYKSLEDSKTYYVRAVGTTVDGVEVDTGYHRLTVNYTIHTNYVVLSLTNDPVNGVIDYATNIVLIDYFGEDEIHIENGKAVVFGDKTLYYDRGFNIEGDFTFVIDCTEMQLPGDDTPNVIIKNDNDKMIKLSSIRDGEGNLRFKLAVTGAIYDYNLFSAPLDTLYLFNGRILIKRINNLYSIEFKEDGLLEG